MISREGFFLVFYAITMDDKGWSREERTLLLIRIFFVFIFIGVMCLLFGVLNFQNAIILAASSMTISFVLSKHVTTMLFKDISERKNYLIDEYNSRTHRKSADILLASILLLFSLCFLFMGGMTMSYLWSLH